MRFNEFKIRESVPDDGTRGGQQPNFNLGNSLTDLVDDTLTKGPPYPPELQHTMSIIQNRLEELGYGVGRTGSDGKYGPRTARAIAAFKQDFNRPGGGDTFTTSDADALASAQPVDNPTPTGNHASGWTRQGSADSLSDIEFATGSESGRVRMQNSGATRNKELDPRLTRILNQAAEEAGVDVVVFSGGQDRRGTPGAQRTGSIRHDDGLAADVWIYSDGQRLQTSREDPIVAKFIAACVANGAKGIGAGPGYMNGVGIHVDLWGERAGARTWGAGGRSANTPTYVAQAYRAGQTGNIG